MSNAKMLLAVTALLWTVACGPKPVVMTTALHLEDEGLAIDQSPQAIQSLDKEQAYLEANPPSFPGDLPGRCCNAWNKLVAEDWCTGRVNQICGNPDAAARCAKGGRDKVLVACFNQSLPAWRKHVPTCSRMELDRLRTVWPGTEGKMGPCPPVGM